MYQTTDDTNLMILSRLTPITDELTRLRKLTNQQQDEINKINDRIDNLWELLG